VPPQGGRSAPLQVAAITGVGGVEQSGVDTVDKFALSAPSRSAIWLDIS
jgi:hypothetical protein